MLTGGSPTAFPPAGRLQSMTAPFRKHGASLQESGQVFRKHLVSQEHVFCLGARHGTRDPCGSGPAGGVPRRAPCQVLGTLAWYSCSERTSRPSSRSARIALTVAAPPVSVVMQGTLFIIAARRTVRSSKNDSRPIGVLMTRAISLL